MSRSPRFEVRSCRTGHLEEVYGSFVPARTAANVLQREDGLSRFIVDTHRIERVKDDRIVWRHGEPTDAARTWIVEQNRRAMIEARTVRT